MLSYIEKYGMNIILESLMEAVKRVRDRLYSSNHQHPIMIITKLNCTVQPADTKFYLLALETDIYLSLLMEQRQTLEVLLQLALPRSLLPASWVGIRLSILHSTSVCAVWQIGSDIQRK